MTGPATDDRFQLDKRLVQEAFNRAAPRYDDIAVLQHEVGDRMLQRLELVKIHHLSYSVHLCISLQ